MQARHTQDDHARLPADRPGDGPEPVDGESTESTRAAVALAVEAPREEAVEEPRRASTVLAAPLAPKARTRPGAGVDAGSPEEPSIGSRLLRNLDLVVLVPAVILALALGAPTLGVLVGAGGWLLQRAVAVGDRILIVRSAEPGSRLGLNFIDSFARIWLLAGAIVLAGVVGGHPDGLAAALVILAAYSLAFAVRIARGREAGPS